MATYKKSVGADKFGAELVAMLEGLKRHNTQVVLDGFTLQGPHWAKQEQEKAYFASGLQIRSGRLFKAQPFNRRSGADAELGLRSPMVYAAIHEFGGMAGRGRKVHIPARPVFTPALTATAQRLIAFFRSKFGWK